MEASLSFGGDAVADDDDDAAGRDVLRELRDGVRDRVRGVRGVPDGD